ncbi:MAG: hypothetical protein ACP5I4_14995 [Oceanipulchritudo sp.]
MFTQKNIRIAALLTFGFSLHAQPVREWGSLIGGGGNEDIQSVTFAPDGEIYLVGNTTSSGDIGGLTPVKIGNDYVAGQSTGYVARISAGGSLLAVTTFGQGTVHLSDVAVSEDAVFVMGHATNTFAPQIDPDAYDHDLAGPVWSIPHNTFQNLTYKCVLIKMPRTLTTVSNATWLGEERTDQPAWGKGVFFYSTSSVWTLQRDKPRVRFFPNGDLCVLANSGLVYSAGRDQLYRMDPDDFTGYIWTAEINSVGNNATASTSDHGDVRSYDLEISPTDGSVYVTGYASGDTGYEPYKDPYAFKFDGATGAQLWDRTGSAGAAAGPYGIWDMKQTAVHPTYISDSTGRAAAVNETGDPFFAGFTDGGASIFVLVDPWTLYGSVDRLDGDGFWGFSGATSASVVGLMPQQGGDWTRLHGFHPHTGTENNRVHGLTAHHGTVAYAVGYGAGIPAVNSWPDNGGSSIIMKLNLEESGTTREFVSHVPSVDSFEEITANGAGRYAAVGKTSGGVPWVDGGFQTTAAGGNDGYLLVFNDPLPGPQGLPVRITTMFHTGTHLQITFESAEAGTYFLKAGLDLSGFWTPVEGESHTAAGPGETIVLEGPVEPTGKQFFIIDVE